MKKYLLALCVVGSLYAAENSKYIPSEWMAQEYSQANKFQIKCFSKWFSESNIDPRGLKIASIGCGTGEIEDELADNALFVHGIDQSQNMINWCTEKYAHKKNLSFMRCFAEELPNRNLYDLAIASGCFHWFQDKPKALRSISKSLRMGGYFFANIETSSNDESFGIKAYHDIIASIPLIGTILKYFTNPTGSSRPDYGDLQIMLSQAGFEIKKADYKSYDWKMSADEWRKTQLPLLLSTPGAQYLISRVSSNWFTQKSSDAAFYLISMSPEEMEQHKAPFFPESKNELVEKIRNNDFLRYSFNKYLNFCFNHMKKNDDGDYTWTYETTVILAQKKQV